MTVLYVREQGAVVGREVEQIKVTLPPPKPASKAAPKAGPQGEQAKLKESAAPKAAEGEGRVGKVLKKIAVRELEQVVIYGNVQVTTQAAALLLDHAVDVVYLSEQGKYRGRLGRDGSHFARLRHAQLNLSNDQQRTMTVAKAIVRAKLTNQGNLLRRLADQQAKAQAAPLRQAAQAIEKLRNDSVRAQDADTLRGFEGKAAVHYFGCFKRLLPAEWGFTERAYHPAPDPFNALLSFGYALLQKDLHAVAQLVGLDPYIGCFHALEYGRPSLVLDLMEEFRPLVVDLPFLLLALTGPLTPKAFTFTDRPERPVLLDEKQLPVVIGAYEQRLESVVQHTAGNQQQKLRRCFELQARLYARVVLEVSAAYEGLVV
jgi:CRISPR-associated protein Cas1